MGNPTVTPLQIMRPKILTVDDSKRVRIIAQQALDAFDCEVSEASNGYNALFAMEKSMPDLILLDINMPVMGGVEMLTMLKSNPLLESIPVIMLASPADHPAYARIATLGVRNTLMKPFEAAALIEKVRSVLDLKPARKN